MIIFSLMVCVMKLTIYLYLSSNLVGLLIPSYFLIHYAVKQNWEVSNIIDKSIMKEL